jgi:class 3 adenylate cyclase
MGTIPTPPIERDPMPYFMDRHDVPGATAQDAAEAHVKDLEAAAGHDVQFFSYWFDTNAGGVFCFAEAPARENLIAVHRESHGLVPNEIISVSEDNVLRFLGTVHDPADASEVTSPFRAILFTDLEGSTQLLEAVGEAAFMVLLTEHDLIIRRALVAARGREVKHTGDGFLASFDEVDWALECSLAVQDEFRERNIDAEGPDLHVRIGIAAGEPVDHNDDIYGSAVNLANRLCDAADADHVVVSDVVRDMGLEQGYTFDEGHERALKGFANPVPVFELLGRPS